MQNKFVGATCRYGWWSFEFWHLCRDVPVLWRHTRLEFLSSPRYKTLPCSISSQRVSSQLLLLLPTRRIETCWNIDSCPRNITLLWKAACRCTCRRTLYMHTTELHFWLNIGCCAITGIVCYRFLNSTQRGFGRLKYPSGVQGLKTETDWTHF